MTRVCTTEEQLRRQLTWLRESWLWLVHTKVLERLDVVEGRPRALDVGCGPGLVMELFSSTFDLVGVDIDPDMVRSARGRGLDVTQGDARDLPFEDSSFDMVYCSYTLLWIDDPLSAVREMARVSRKFVVCLAEPDYGGRICHPEEVADLDRFVVESLIEEGAAPFIGRRLGDLMETADLKVELGVHSGAWSPDRLRNEADAEWDSIAKAVGPRADSGSLSAAKAAWDRALADRSLFLFNPVFYAIGMK